MTAHAPRLAAPRAKTLDATRARTTFAQRSAADEKVRQALCASIERHGFTHDELAAACRTSRRNVSDWCNPNKKDAPNLSHVLLMPAPVRNDLVRALAAAAGLECRAMDADRDDALLLLATVEREGSEAKLATLKAIADGHESDAELVEQARQYQEAADAYSVGHARAVRKLRDRRA